MIPNGLKQRAAEQMQAMASDIHKAINAYSKGDRSNNTLLTLASTKVLADTLGTQLPGSTWMSAKDWTDVLSVLVDRFSGVNKGRKDNGTPKDL